MDAIVTWANRACVDAAVLELVIEGKAILDWDPIEEDIRVRLTEAEHRGRTDA